ncbi:8682a642-1ad9-4d42-9713-68ae6ded47ca [Thermothielavioides terrestris]|uniref:8682a642-1ad9-4d42-9713-68ae6ded47ca n=1 Tax=Thermothielavioides terrestris TaxID=2587410 RepID=A0A3S4AKB9_9PEZI|nr:8682a642-1ad9-4d42-9713-68ae6ded47ca [Thermothielavioides terrestris]
MRNSNSEVQLHIGFDIRALNASEFTRVFCQDAGSKERPKKENILDLKKYMDQRITVKFNGGREATGVLKGYDALMNLVLDDVEEVLRDDEGNTTTRPLGLVVVRGTLLVVVSPVNGSEVIANPFLQADED